MIRPLIFAIVEYVLAFYVYRSGKFHKNLFALIIFLLATYQLGEVLIFATNGSEVGFKFAYVATTLLPPLGILLVERLTKKKYQYEIFQIISFVFVLFILFEPQIVKQFSLGQFCVRVEEYHKVMQTLWQYYYQLTLMITMALLARNIFVIKDRAMQLKLKWVLLGYLIFDGVGVVILSLVPSMGVSATSLICALALFASFIFAKTARDCVDEM